MPLGFSIIWSTVTFDLFLRWATQGPLGPLVICYLKLHVYRIYHSYCVGVLFNVSSNLNTTQNVFAAGWPWLDDSRQHGWSLPGGSIRSPQQHDSFPRLHWPTSENEIWLSCHYGWRKEINFFNNGVFVHFYLPVSFLISMPSLQVLLKKNVNAARFVSWYHYNWTNLAVC